MLFTVKLMNWVNTNLRKIAYLAYPYVATI